MKEKIKNYIRTNRENIIDMLKALVEIPSVSTEGDKNAPFGKPCLDALKAVEEIYASDGYKTEIEENKNFLLGVSDGDEKLIGIFSHADVVPAVESDWEYTSPFKPIEKDGFLIGRGIEDNKSGVVGAIWALRALKSVGAFPKSRVLLYTGSDEENGMSDIIEFAKKHEMPDFSIVPDNEYPVCRGEKTIVDFFVTFNEPFTDILDISGGQAFNIALGKVNVTLKNDDDLFEELERAVKDVKECSISKDFEAITLTAIGKSTHAAYPDSSLNALSLAIDALSKCTISENDKTVLKNAKKLVSNPYFENAGLSTTDIEFGKTTCVNGLVSTQNGHLKLSFDCRFGSEIEADTLINSYKNYFNSIDAEYSEVKRLDGYSISKDDPLIKAVMEAFAKVTGDAEKKPYLSFGGTYARFLKNAISTGTHLRVTPPLSMPEGHGSVHQPDETLDIEGFLHGIEILSHMIIKADEVLHK